MTLAVAALASAAHALMRPPTATTTTRAAFTPPSHLLTPTRLSALRRPQSVHRSSEQTVEAVGVTTSTTTTSSSRDGAIPWMSAGEIRRLFLEYFQNEGHEVVASSTLVPKDDPTLLFTNAGMVQFKDVFLGGDVRSYKRAASSQKCVRAGGKHNDLDNVGYTARHHTFFEMLGNFSFGSYFKREAIRYAWRFLTEVLRLPKDRLWVTVFEDDQQAEDIWLKEVGVSPSRLARCGAKDNFWSMGDTGPCGPCSEIFFDHGETVEGGPPGSPEEDGDRYVEVWNIVFMEYNRGQDGTLTPLPSPSVDTGMGLERIAAVMQGVHSNYDTDIFRHLTEAASRALGIPHPSPHTSHHQQHHASSSLNVIADHIRSTVFLIAEGVVPQNVGRGYVLRRVMRRAIRHGFQLTGSKEPFFHRLVQSVVDVMGEAYPSLHAKQHDIEKVIKAEEHSFAKTLDTGMKLLDDTLRQMESDGVAQVPGEAVFRLYDTYGFPVDLTADIAREKGLTIDTQGFDQCMQRQRELSKTANKFSAATELLPSSAVASSVADTHTAFTGYDLLEGDAQIAALFAADGSPTDALSPGQNGTVVLSETPFYAEAGGQIGDQGVLRSPSTGGGELLFHVVDTQKRGDVYLHIGVCEEGHLEVGGEVYATVDGERRQRIVLNHSATHLLHAALRRILGDHVEQRGSHVSDQRLRFDFTHDAPITTEQLAAVEASVNGAIRGNYEVLTEELPYAAAQQAGALGLFEAKYGETVRVLSMGDYSKELCGGTHASRTGDIGVMKIVSESSIQTGVRRVEAVTGPEALRVIQEESRALQHICSAFKTNTANAPAACMDLQERSRSLERELAQVKLKLAESAASEALSAATLIGDLSVLVARMPDGMYDGKTLRSSVESLHEKQLQAADGSNSNAQGAVTLLAAADPSQDKVSIVCASSVPKRVNASNMVKLVAERCGGKGGGRPEMAQGGGTDITHIDGALEDARRSIEKTVMMQAGVEEVAG